MPNPAARDLIRNARSPWRMKLFYLTKLPTLVWWGVRITELCHERCQTSLPFRWRTQNPFRSIYFAALSGAAELSTGMLASLAIAGRGEVSMLITKAEAEYVKKATGPVTFTCQQGTEIMAAANEAITSGKPRTIRAESVGCLADGTVVARFWFTWSFRKK
jgi:hypothetical protein